MKKESKKQPIEGHLRSLTIKTSRSSNGALRLFIGDARQKEKIFVPWNHFYESTTNFAYDLLNANGWNIVGHGEIKGGYIILCDNWDYNADQFKSVKDIKTKLVNK